jgi:hypothetical protein
VSTEERVRSAAEAMGDTVRHIRPLPLHLDAIDFRAPVKPAQPSLLSRWQGWLVPLAGAAAVVAVAATLVAVRGSAGGATASHATSAATSTSAASSTGTSNGIPPYYVTLNNATPGSWAEEDAVLADTHTGKTLATFKPPANATWQIATTANDSTFVLYASTSPATKTENTDFYVIHVSSTDPRQSRLTKIPLTISYDTGIADAAVSADGTVLAVFTQKVTQTKNVEVNKATGKTIEEAAAVEASIRTYSLATGQVLRTWTANGTRLSWGSIDSVGIDEGEFPAAVSIDSNSNLQWLDDGQTLSWTSPKPNGEWELETLNTADPGTSLAADSRVVDQFPHQCLAGYIAPVLTLDGKSAICASVASQDAPGQPVLVSYSVATGKLEHVLYRFPATAKSSKDVQEGGHAVSWWAPSGAYVIGLLENSVIRGEGAAAKLTNIRDIGVMTPTKFTPLPITQTGANAGNGAFVAF